MGVRLAVALAALIVAGAASAGEIRKPAPMRFQSVVRTSTQSIYNFPDVGHYYSGVYTQAGYEQNPSIPAADRAKLERIDLQKHFVITAEYRSRTSGWSIRIRRIELRRVNRSRREFCVFVHVGRPGPGQAIVQREYENIEYVQLLSKPFRIDEFHWSIPTATVMLTTTGTVLYRSTEGTDQHNRPIVTGSAKTCRR